MLRLVPGLLALVLVGCDSGLEPVRPPVDTDRVATDTDEDTDLPPTPTPSGPDGLALPAHAALDNGRLATADTCQPCHSTSPSALALTDDDGVAVGPYDLWEASMEANSARDPIWRAAVSAEIAATPAAAEQIGTRCMTCHAPMAASEAQANGLPPPDFDTLTEDSEMGRLAREGNSCTLCHQILPDNFGQPSSFKGNYILSSDQTLFGPHTNPAQSLMEPSGWTPEYAPHINEAGLCATCHTLATETLDPDGTPTGDTLNEQTPYIEMLNSSSASSTCQSCHFASQSVAGTGFTTQVARQPDGTDFPDLPQRSVGRHTIVGGNTLVPQLFATFPEILKPRASPEAFLEKIQAARTQLQQNAGTIQLDGLAVQGDLLSFRTIATARTGHKFPTGIPIRRVWIRVDVKDAAGSTVFVSGASDSRGKILKDGVPAAFESVDGPIEPHHQVISSADQVQVYEAVMADVGGDPTFLLLRGAGYVKDTRLLPEGWSATFADIDMIAPAGVDGDQDYLSGGDDTQYEVDVSGHTGPFTVEARLLYQTVSARYLAELYEADTPETQALEAMLQFVDTRPEVVASTTRNSP